MEFFGIDIGDGESAVAYARALNQYPDMLDIDGEQNLMTVLSIAPDGTRRIGKAAVLGARNQQEMHVRFKSRYLADAEAARWIEAFARALRERIQASGRMLDWTQAQVCIGCPSGWDDAARARYKALMENAGFEHVSIVSESRAALVYARESGDLRLAADQLSKPILIIDAGSSTIDYTYVSDMQIGDWGEVSLGGGVIDSLLLDYNIDRMENREVLRDIFARHPKYRAVCELFARGVKESYFNAESSGEPLLYPVESSFRIYTDPPTLITVECDAEIMDTILRQPLRDFDGRSFFEVYHSSLLRQKEKLHDPPQVVLMTGGASHMPFMRERAREMFPGAAVTMGIAPEFAIARGLCFVLRMEEKRKGFMRDVEALIQSDIIENLVLVSLPRLFRELSPLLVDEIRTELVPGVFARWQSGQIRTLDDMQEAMKAESKTMLQKAETIERIAPIVASWLQTLRPQLEDYTSPICDENGMDRAALRLPNFINIETGLPFSPDKLISFDAIAIMIEVVVAAVVGMLAGGTGVALITTGPVGAVIGVVIGLVTAALGNMVVKKAVMGMDLPRFIRGRFSIRSIDKKLEKERLKMIDDFTRQLERQAMDKTEDIIRMSDNIAHAIEKQLYDEMEQAIFLIR